MKRNAIEPWNRKRQTRPGAALAKGALLWGSTYATAASIVAIYLTPGAPSCMETFLSALLVMAPCGAFAELVKKRILNNKNNRTNPRTNSRPRSLPKHRQHNLRPRYV